jgi:S1-C subfamily serine protease
MSNRNWYWFRSKIIYTLGLVICLGGVSLAISRQQSISSNCNISECPIPTSSQSEPTLTVEQIQQLAQNITVKISTKQLPQTLLGSGTLLKKTDNIYTVITNAHVLRAAKPPYQIHTVDGSIYNVAVLTKAKFLQEDLAVLQFSSPGVVYTEARLGNTSSLQVGEQVFVGGFISKGTADDIPESEVKTVKNSWYRFVFTAGEVSILLTKPLVGGYQIGYTNDVRKGMSGAPLLNINGEVVGINSLHKNPLWDSSEVYQDGSQPEPQVEKLIIDSSMAIPINQQVLLHHLENN